jgi:hypothetical protein
MEGPMQPPTSIPEMKPKMRAFVCTLSTRKFRDKLEKLVATDPVFNESWTTGELFMTARIGGMRQYGDIVVRHHSRRPRNEVIIEHRAGDEALVEALTKALAKELTPKEPRLAPGKKRPAGMAYFFEMIRSTPLRRHILIAESVIEEAYEMDFEDYPAVRRKLEFLSMVPRLGVLHKSLDARVQKDYQEATRIRANPKICLFEGQKIALPYRVRVISEDETNAMVMHFAKVSADQMLIGWAAGTTLWE